MGDLIQESRAERAQRRAHQQEQRRAALAEVTARQAKAEAVIAEAVRRGYGEQERLALVPRDRLVHLLDLANAAAASNLHHHLHERDRRIGAENAAAVERGRTETFKGLFEVEMNVLERLGGHELPELARFRMKYEAAVKRAAGARDRKALKATKIEPALRKRIERMARLEGLGAKKIHARFLAEYERDEWFGNEDAPPSATQIETALREMQNRALKKAQ